MKKNLFKTITALNLIMLFFSCAGKKSETQNLPVAKIHSWYYFTNSGFKTIDAPQNVPTVLEKPWTETVRIASAGCSGANGDAAYALVNRAGLLCFSGNNITFYQDNSIFSEDTADFLVFSDGKPVFCLYRSSFFNSNPDKNPAVHTSRPFLVEFSPDSRIFYPIVSYSNLNLKNDDQVTGYFWNGKTWACSAKKTIKNGYEFSYFFWEPLVPLTEASPALGREFFSFNPMSETEYKKMNLPKLFNDAPEELKSLLFSIPDEFSFYVSWRNSEGTSPVTYSHKGSSDNFSSARAGFSSGKKYIAAVFSDGTVYLKRISDNQLKVFRLPLLPPNFSYGEMAISKDTLYVSWEESSFFKTARAGFISVDLEKL
ncbi:hypothetical protein [Treponema sp.]|uniref:hypothetical protein n=1 Tax=Treponema sp. TaxID=166 RepID=UPI003F079599